MPLALLSTALVDLPSLAIVIVLLMYKFEAPFLQTLISAISEHVRLWGRRGRTLGDRLVLHSWGSFGCDRGHFKSKVWPQNLALALLLKTVEGLLGEEVVEEAVGLHLCNYSSVLTQCIQLLLHSVVPVSQVPTG